MAYRENWATLTAAAGWGTCCLRSYRGMVTFCGIADWLFNKSRQR